MLNNSKRSNLPTYGSNDGSFGTVVGCGFGISGGVLEEGIGGVVGADDGGREEEGVASLDVGVPFSPTRVFEGLFLGRSLGYRFGGPAVDAFIAFFLLLSSLFWLAPCTLT